MADTFTPPADVARNAQRALDVRATKPPSQQGMTPVGLARANQLANREAVSLDTVQRMVSYFARHEVDKQGSTWDEQGKGWQAWFGWGGDEGRTWANQIMKEHTMETKASRRHSEADMKLIRSARRMAESIKGYMTELGDDMEDDEAKSVKAIELGAEFNTRQRMMVSSLIEVTHEAGKFDKGIGANGAHYMEAAKNPFASQGIACEYCYFYQPDGNCAVVEGIIEEYAVCKLWIIPEAVIMMETMESTMEMSDVVPVEAEMETEEAVAMTNLPLDTPLTIELGDEVRALARRLLGGRQ
jgi:Pyruvate/2-oxoacid:ferredoxin oxidoreductase delta subunit